MTVQTEGRRLARSASLRPQLDLWLVWLVGRDHPPETGIGGVGNKKVTSKRDYMYQQLDGEASISCH